MTVPIQTTNVVVGPAALYVAPKFTPLPADSSTLFDPTNWTGKLLTANGATAVTLQVTTQAGTATTASLTSFATITAAAVQAALAGLSNVGAGNVIVTGAAGGPFTVVFANGLGPVTLSISTSTGGTGPVVSGGLWIPVGATEAGWTFGATKNTQDITVEEQSTPVATTITSQSVAITGHMSEDTMQQWQWALGAVKTLIAAGTGQPAVTQLALSDVLAHYAVALEAINAYGFARRYYIPDTVATESVSSAFRRAATQRLIAASFRSVCPTNQIIVREITAPGS